MKKGQFTVYNFEVETFHSYFVQSDEYLVHNSCDWLNTVWKGFSKGKLAEHFARHGWEFGNITQVEYLRKAKDFAQEFSDKFKIGKVGNILVKYDPESRRVAVANMKDRELRTFYIADTRDADPFAAAMKLAAELTK